MQFWNLLLCSTQEPGVKSWAGGAGKCDFCVCDARQSTQSLGSEDCYFYHNSIWSIQYMIPYLTSPQNINNHLLNSTDSTFHIWTSHHFLIYDIQSTHFISLLQAAPADQHLTKPGNRHIYRFNLIYLTFSECTNILLVYFILCVGFCFLYSNRAMWTNKQTNSQNLNIFRISFPCFNLIYEFTYLSYIQKYDTIIGSNLNIIVCDVAVILMNRIWG